MPRIFFCRLALQGARLTWAIAFACLMAGDLPAWGQFDTAQLIPANFDSKTDSQAFQWSVDSDGTVRCNNGGFYGPRLQLNGNGFSSQQNLMTADGRQYVLTGYTNNGLTPVRRVKFDLETAAVRLIDSFTNSSAAVQVANVTLTLQTNYTGMYTSDAAVANPTVLGPKETGVIGLSRLPNYPSVLAWLGSKRSKVKPTLNPQSSQLQVNYSLSVPAGETVSIAHGIALRRTGLPPVSRSHTRGRFPSGGLPGSQPAGPVDAKSLGKLMEIFSARGWLKDIPRDLRKTIVNVAAHHGTSVEPGPSLDSLTQLAERYDIERGASDVLVIDENARLTGRLEAEGLVATTRFGKAQLDLNQVALVVGGAGGERPVSVHLRNGEILTGSLAARTFKLVCDGGTEVALVPQQVGALFAHASSTDGKIAQGTEAFAATYFGDRLALAGEQPEKIRALSPWGPMDLDLKEIESIDYVREPQPGHRLVLKDQTRVSAILLGAELKLNTARWGAVKLPPHTLERLWRATVAAEEPPPDFADDDAPEVRVAHVGLVGENLLAGLIQNKQLHVSTGNGQSIIDPRQLRRVERRDDEPGAPLNFILTSGSTITGVLEDPVIEVRAQTRTWRVPAQHLMSAYVPKPPAVPTTGDASDPDDDKDASDTSASPADPVSAAANPNPRTALERAQRKRLKALQAEIETLRAAQGSAGEQPGEIHEVFEVPDAQQQEADPFQ